MRRRWLLLLLLFPLYTVVLAEIGWIFVALIASSPDEPFWVFTSRNALWIPFEETEGWTNIIIPAGVLAFAQLVFLLPVLQPRRMIQSQGHSLMVSVVAAGACGALLTVGLFFAVVEASGFMTGRADPVDDVIDVFGDVVNEDWSLWPLVLASWILWTPVLIVFARRNPSPRLLSRIAKWLLAGTILEILIVIPLDIMVRRRTSCYCSSGSAIALCASVCALLWLSGPGIVLALTSKRRRWWFEGHCWKCGYEKGPSPGEKCPECGCEWAGNSGQSHTRKSS